MNISSFVFERFGENGWENVNNNNSSNNNTHLISLFYDHKILYNAIPLL